MHALLLALVINWNADLNATAARRTASGRREYASFMTTLRGLSLSASLTVADLAASLRWYRDVVGFAVSREFERDGRPMAVSLQAGDVRILLTQDDAAKGADRVKGAGFSLQITTEQDLDELANSIEERGGALESRPVDTPWGPRMFRLRDPDGFRFTFSSPPRAPQQ